jgi:ABC-type nitrate/sulfonate/bicarbonate transport system permease component
MQSSANRRELASLHPARELPGGLRTWRARWLGRVHSVWPPLLVLAALVVLWQWLVHLLHVDPQVLPPPSLVVKSTWADRSNLWPAIVMTTKETVFGLLVAIAFAFVVGIAIDWSRITRRSVYPLLVVSQTLPIVALAPMVIIWFGFGILPKIVLVALFTFFAMAVGLVQGLGSSDPDAMNLLRTMRASRLQLLLRVRLPSALPQFFTGLKISVTYAFVSAIVAEFVGAVQGLGVYMIASKSAFRSDLVFGAVLVTALLTLALFAIVAILERIVTPWKRPVTRDHRW